MSNPALPEIGAEKMTSTINPDRVARRPIFDPLPDSPVKAYGWKVERGTGSVLVSAEPAVHGRFNPRRTIAIGTLVKYGRIWKALAPDGTEFVGERQGEAGSLLYQWATLPPKIVLPVYERIAAEAEITVEQAERADELLREQGLAIQAYADADFVVAAMKATGVLLRVKIEAEKAEVAS
jgi:hypothetical protein